MVPGETSFNKIRSWWPQRPILVSHQAIFAILKITFGALANQYFKLQKSKKTKNVPLDEIYLEYGLIFELEFFV